MKDMGVFLKKNQQKGFTLIEIVLVLAIAGVIFLIVFLAVQGANKGKKDTAAKSAAARLIAAAEQFSSNNSGEYPDNCTDQDNANKVFDAQYFYGVGNASSGGYTCSTTTDPTADNGVLRYHVSGPNIIVDYWSSTSGSIQQEKN